MKFEIIDYDRENIIKIAKRVNTFLNKLGKYVDLITNMW